MDGYEISVALSAEHARTLAREHAIALVLLGRLDGARGELSLLEEIRSSECWQSSLAVVVLGRGVDELELLRAFEAGADDYVADAAPYLELRARLRALLRRAHSGDAVAQRTKLTVGPLVIDAAARTATLHGQPLALRRMEFQLLAQLAADPDRVFSRQELLREVWGYRYGCSSRTLDSHASRLRRKLEPVGSPRWVVAVRGVGYRLR